MFHLSDQNVYLSWTSYCQALQVSLTSFEASELTMSQCQHGSQARHQIWSLVVFQLGRTGLFLDQEFSCHVQSVCRLYFCDGDPLQSVTGSNQPIVQDFCLPSQFWNYQTYSTFILLEAGSTEHQNNQTLNQLLFLYVSGYLTNRCDHNSDCPRAGLAQLRKPAQLGITSSNEVMCFLGTVEYQTCIVKLCCEQ